MFMAVQSIVVFTLYIRWFYSSFISPIWCIYSKWDILWFTIKEKYKNMDGNVIQTRYIFE